MASIIHPYDQTPRSACLDDIEERGIVAEKADDSPVSKFKPCSCAEVKIEKNSMNYTVRYSKTLDSWLNLPKRRKHCNLAADATMSSP